jgi:hypothetical protein
MLLKLLQRHNLRHGLLIYKRMLCFDELSSPSDLLPAEIETGPTYPIPQNDTRIDKASHQTRFESFWHQKQPETGKSILESLVGGVTSRSWGYSVAKPSRWR